MMRELSTTMIGTFIGVICGFTLGAWAAPDSPIDPRLLQVAEHVCRVNQGPKLVKRLRKDHVSVRCHDTALFEDVLVQFDDTAKIGGAEIPEKN